MKRKDEISVKQKIQDASIHLLVSKSYLDITVSDVIEKAKVARASFYRSFKSFDEVLSAIVDGLVKELNDRIIPLFVRRDYKEVKAFLIRVLTSLKNGEIPELRMKEDNRQLIFNKIARIYNLKETLKDKTLSQRYNPTIHLSIVLDCIFVWTSHDFQDDIEELADYIIKHIKV